MVVDVCGRTWEEAEGASPQPSKQLSYDSVQAERKDTVLEGGAGGTRGSAEDH